MQNNRDLQVGVKNVTSLDDVTLHFIFFEKKFSPPKLIHGKLIQRKFVYLKIKLLDWKKKIILKNNLKKIFFRRGCLFFIFLLRYHLRSKSKLNVCLASFFPKEKQNN